MNPKYSTGERVRKSGEPQEGRVQAVTLSGSTFRYNVKWDNGPTTLHDEDDLLPATLPPHYP
jgi:hypothetical protein